MKELRITPLRLVNRRPRAARWTCGLVACRDALGALGYHVSETKLSRALDGAGCELPGFGMTSFHVGLILASAGLAVEVRTRSLWLRSLLLADKRGRRPLPGDPVESRDALHALVALSRRGGICNSESRTSSDPIRAVTECVASGGAAVVCISAKELYGIDENWNHYMAVIRTKKGMLQVVDRYVDDELGTDEVWEDCRTRALAYNWQTWSGDAILATRS